MSQYSPSNRFISSYSRRIVSDSVGIPVQGAKPCGIGCEHHDQLHRTRAQLQHLFDDLADEPAALRVRTGQAVCTEGQLAETFFLVRQGLVKLSLVSSAGTQSIAEILGPGDCFGEECALEGRPRYVETATALTLSVLGKVPRLSILKKLSEEPDFRKIYIAMLVHRVHEYEGSMAQHAFENSEQRLAIALAKLATLGTWLDESTVMLPRLTHETFAEMVGTTRPRITWFLGKFASLGILHSGSPIRLNVHKLYAEIVKNASTIDQG
jgi:CRP/FNR family transcriptional regulator, cyclic AMP receptor protein